MFEFLEPVPDHVDSIGFQRAAPLDHDEPLAIEVRPRGRVGRPWPAVELGEEEKAQTFVAEAYDSGIVGFRLTEATAEAEDPATSATTKKTAGRRRKARAAS